MTEAVLPGRYFHVPAREMLLDTRDACPAYPLLALDGVAVTPAGQHHLVLSLLPTVRFYLGPDQASVQRRAQLLVAGLEVRSLQGRPEMGRAVREWVLLAWDVMLDELVEAIAKDSFPVDRPAPR